MVFVTQQTNSQWVTIIRDIMQDVNEEAEYDRIVKIGVLQRLNKDDSCIVYSKNHDLLQNRINKLLGVNNARRR